MKVTTKEKERRSKATTKETKEIIVKFLDIDPLKISFAKAKPNKHGGTQIGILYEGKTLFVKYEGVTPFGLNEKIDKNGESQGTTMQINCEDSYLKKAKELDKFFINYMHSLNKKIPIEAYVGYDEHGQGGSWKRICKKPYKLVENYRKYLDYPHKMEFTLFYRDDKLVTRFFTWYHDQVDYEFVTIGPRSRVKFIAAWFSISTGTFGSTLKPKLMQVAFKGEHNMFIDCLLSDEEEEEEKVKVELEVELSEKEEEEAAPAVEMYAEVEEKALF